LQRTSTKKAMAAAVTFFCLLWSCVATQLREEGDGNYCRLLLPAVERSSTKKVTTPAVTFFSRLWSCAVAQQKKAILLRSYVAPRRR